MSELKMSFGAETSTSYEAKVSKYIPAWTITEATLKEFKVDTVTGKDGTTYSGIRMVFEDDNEHVFDHFLFGINKQEDLVRKTTADGREMPSQKEVLDSIIKHILWAFNPTVAEKFTNALKGKSITVAQYLGLAEKTMAPNLNKKCFIKIVGNNNNYATMPRIIAVFDNGEEAVLTNNFISLDESKLSFSKYELRKKSEMESRKPSSIGLGSVDLNLSNLDEDLNSTSSLMNSLNNLDDDLPF